jgi:hypothetical protein
MTRMITLILLMFGSCVLAQNIPTATFYFNARLDSNELKYTNYYEWFLNGIKLENQKDTVILTINYPKLDTLILLSKNGERRLIITRFYDKHKYELWTIGCCRDIDIFDADRLIEYGKTRLKIQNDKANKESEFNIMRELYEKNEIGKVRFKLLNNISKDSIGGTFGFIDANYTSGVLLEDNSIINSETPLTTGESGYCFTIKIGVVTTRIVESINSEKTNLHIISPSKEIEYMFVKELASFEFRFFNSETLLVSFDNMTKQIKLELN